MGNIGESLRTDDGSDEQFADGETQEVTAVLNGCSIFGRERDIEVTSD